MYLCFIYILRARIYVFTDASGAGYAPNLPDHATLHACKVPYSRRVLTYLFPFASHIFFSAPASHIFVLRGRITVAIEAPALLARPLDHCYLQFLHMHCVRPLHRRHFFKLWAMLYRRHSHAHGCGHASCLLNLATNRACPYFFLFRVQV